MMSWHAVLVQLTGAMQALERCPAGAAEDAMRHQINTAIGMAYVAKCQAELEIPVESCKPKSY